MTQLMTDQGQMVRVPAGTWKVDPAHSSVAFEVKHMMISTVRGQFREFDGTLEAAEDDPANSRARGSVKVASIDTGNAERDEHLRSPDFFDVKRFPMLTFKSKRVERATQRGHLTLVGDLTIHGVTKEVAFDVTAPTPERKTPYGTVAVGAEAKAKINRRDFGLTWNQALEAGGVLVSDEVNLDISLELSKKAP